MRSRNIIRIAIGTALLLSIPLVAMQISDDVDWTLSDFLIAGTLLMGSGVLYEFVVSKVNPKHKAIVVAIFVFAVMLVWAELAVGVFGTPFAGS